MEGSQGTENVGFDMETWMDYVDFMGCWCFYIYIYMYMFNGILMGFVGMYDGYPMVID